MYSGIYLICPDPDLIINQVQKWVHTQIFVLSPLGNQVIEGWTTLATVAGIVRVTKENRE